MFVLTLVALYGLGMMFASLFLLWGREAWHMVNLLQEPVYLLSGTNFPVTPIFPLVRRLAVVARDPAGRRDGRDAAGAVPHPRAVRGRTEVAILGGSAVVFFFAARRLLRNLERRAKEEGRLTVRWQ